MTLSQKKEAAEVMMDTGLSERAACRLLELQRSSKRYESRAVDDLDLRLEIKAIAD